MAADVAPVTVAIATFNRAALLVEALKSCRNQTLRPASIVVVDDGSSDGTREAVASLGWPEITYFNPGKVGLGRARNIATSLTNTKYLCIMDDDDIMLPNRIRDHMESFKSGVQMSHGGWINFNALGELEFKPGKVVCEDVIVYAGNAITHGACCYLTERLRNFSYREDAIGGIDFDLAVRLVRDGLACAHTGSYVLLRRRHESSMSNVHGDGQQNLRRAVVAKIDRMRPQTEIEQRRQKASAVLELFATPIPSLTAIYRYLADPQPALRVTVTVPRQAGDFFLCMEQLAAAWQQVDVVDEDADLTSNLLLVSPYTRRTEVLAEFKRRAEKPWARFGVRSAATLQPSDRLFTFPVSGGHFRLALKSFDLRELLFAYRIIARQRGWTWYVVVRSVQHKGQLTTVYGLVSAPFQAQQIDDQDKRFVDDLKAFVYTQTSLRAAALPA